MSATMGVRTEYEMNASRKRDYLTVWSGPFFSVYEAIGVSLPYKCKSGRKWVVYSQSGGLDI